MDNAVIKNMDARRRADEKFTKNKQRDLDVMGHQRRIQQAEAEKLVRLRGLRLAKEAADRQTEAIAAAEAAAAGPKRTRIRRPKPKPVETESEL